MKVLLLTWDFPPARGGIQTWMLELARRLPNARVHVLAPAQKGARAFDRAAGVRVSRLTSARLGQKLWLVALCLRTLWYCLVDRPDLVVCGHVVTAPAALIVRWLVGVPYVVFTHAYEIRRRRTRNLFSYLLRRARLVIANSEFTRSIVLRLGVASARVRVVHPGVEVKHFFPSRNGDEKHGCPTLLSVSRLAELYKGHDTAIRAMPVVRAKIPDAHYLIAGDGPLRGYLERVAASLGMEAAVQFLGDVSNDQLLDLYRSSDLLVLLGRDSVAEGGAEGFGIVILEAGACGKPVVAGRSGGLVDAVEDGVTGILVDPEDPAAVAEALIAVLSDQALAQRMGQAGRKRVLAQFTWDKVIGDARKVFAEAAKEP
jgi:phosphatidylinositol alpha-1,6-mannosyltransferase